MPNMMVALRNISGANDEEKFRKNFQHVRQGAPRSLTLSLCTVAASGGET